MKLGSANIEAVFIKHSSPRKLLEVAERLRETNRVAALHPNNRPKVVLCLCGNASKGLLDNMRNAKGKTMAEQIRNATKEYFRRFSTAPVVDIEEKPSTLIDLVA